MRILDSQAVMWFITFLPLLVFVESLEVGDVCDGNGPCGDLMVCQSGRCTCSSDANMIPVFRNMYYQSGVKCIRKEMCSYIRETRQLCSAGRCILEEGRYEGLCGCTDAMVTVNFIDNSTCWPYVRRKFHDFCSHTNPMCDEMKGLTCNHRCLCREGDFYNFSAKECMSKESYLKMFNINVYQARWGDYCVQDMDCLGILECAYNNTCECPHDCYGYLEEHNACYCGDWEVPTGPVIVGVFVGFIIICFWCYQIDKLCKKYQIRPQETTRDTLRARYEGVSDREESERTVPPASDPPPQYEATVAEGNSDAPTAPPYPMVENDRNSVNNQPDPLRKRKLPTSNADLQHMKK